MITVQNEPKQEEMIGHELTCPCIKHTNASEGSSSTLNADVT